MIETNCNFRIHCAGNITIGSNVLIGRDVFIIDHNHGKNPESRGGYLAQDLEIKDIVIGDGVWLGHRVCVVPGVKIGEHSIIGAGSVVTRSIPSYCIAAGCPAKVLKRWNFERKQWERVCENI